MKTFGILFVTVLLPQSALASADDFRITSQDRAHTDSRYEASLRLERSGFFQDLATTHEHLEMYGDEQSLRTLYGWAIQDGFGFNGYNDFVQQHTVLRPFGSQEGGLDHFLFQTIPLYAHVIGKDPGRIQEWSRLAVLAASRQHITRLALRFSPGWLTHYSGMDWDLALDEVLRGLAKGVGEVQAAGHQIELQLYQIATRELSGSDNAEFARNVKFYLKHKQVLAAFDIAGSELLAPISNFVKELEPLVAAKAIDRDIHFTFHSGEEIRGASRSMRDAIDAGADRLGHGINGSYDATLNALIRQRNLPIEVCPTSNVLVAVAPSIAAHPLPRLIAKGYRPSISTDDPLVFSTLAKNPDGSYGLRPLSLWDEYAHLILPTSEGGMGLKMRQLRSIRANGRAQFADFQPKAPGRKSLNQVLHERFSGDCGSLLISD